MSDLLDTAIAAHGGWDRWGGLQALEADLLVGGILWKLKGQEGVLDEVRVSADLHRQHVEYSPFGKPGQHSAYEPDRTAIIADDGTTVEECGAPRQTFDGHQMMTPWNEQQLIYFSGYAMWTYLTTPFLFKLPGFKSEEIEPWAESESETWRRLRVEFPDDVHSHSPVQTFYFGDDGILRRHDYSVDILGGTTSANIALDPQNFDGIVYPTKRRIYSAGPDNRPIAERLAITIDFQNISLR